MSLASRVAFRQPAFCNKCSVHLRAGLIVRPCWFQSLSPVQTACHRWKTALFRPSPVSFSVGSHRVPAAAAWGYICTSPWATAAESNWQILTSTQETYQWSHPACVSSTGVRTIRISCRSVSAEMNRRNELCWSGSESTWGSQEWCDRSETGANWELGKCCSLTAAARRDDDVSCHKWETHLVVFVPLALLVPEFSPQIISTNSGEVGRISVCSGARESEVWHTFVFARLNSVFELWQDISHVFHFWFLGN